MELKLCKELFEIKFLVKAVESFENLADISISNYSKKYYVIYFDNCLYSDDVTAREFENYLIDLQNVVNDNVD